MLKNFITLIILILSLTIHAHKALLLVEDNGDGTIYIEAGISTGGNAAGNMIYITEIESGKPIWQGPVPDSGNFDLPIPSKPFLVTLDMGKGHKITKRGPLNLEIEKKQKHWSDDISEAKISDFSEGKRVAVDLVPLEKLLKQLTINTDIQVINILGKDASIEEIESFIKKNEDKIRKIASAIDGFVNIRSIWENENVYNYLRRYNIRISEIDLASPLDPQISGVAIRYLNDSPNYNIWLNFVNIIKMAEIATKDLSILFPSDSLELNKNLKNFKKEIIKLKIKYENLFINVEDVDVAVIGDVFDYILSETLISVSVKLPKEISGWSDKEYQKLNNLGKKLNKRVILSQWMPVDKKLKDIIETQKFNVAVLSDGLNSQDKQTIFDILNENYLNLYQALMK